MKLDLGISRLDAPEGYLPSTVILLGKEDRGKALSAGPTVAKTKTPQYRRTLAIGLSPVGEHAVAEEVLAKGLAEVQTRARAKVVKVDDLKVDGAPAKSAELRHTFDDMPVFTFAMLSASQGFVRSVMLTVLDDPKVLKEAKAEFELVLASLRSAKP